MEGQFAALWKELGRNLKDLLPVLLVVALFQGLIVREPLPDLEHRMLGVVFVLLGMTLFVRGLEMSIFPVGEGLADGLARRGSLPLLLVFSFALGFGSTAAEPALAAVADQAARAASSPGTLGGGADTATLSLSLRYGAAFGVGLAVAIGVLRIAKGWPVIWFVLPGYGLASLMAIAHPSPLSGIALDAGAAATSAINIPLMVALGVGLASILRGRNPLVDGFGVVALASLTPMLLILVVSWLFL